MILAHSLTLSNPLKWNIVRIRSLESSHHSGLKYIDYWESVNS